MKILDVIEQNIVITLDEIDEELTKEVQSNLSRLFLLNKNDVDGIVGPKTKAAWKYFKEINKQNKPNLIGKGSLEILLSQKELPQHNSLVTKEQIDYIMDVSISPYTIGEINECLKRFKINTPNRIRHFLSQIAHESAGLRYTKELATGMDYEGRMDLGNWRSGDGVRFKGAGFIQLTGRKNYEAFAKFMGDDKIHQIGCTYVANKYPCTSAGFWWHNNAMNAKVDKGWTVRQITRKVNGGFNGLADRVKYYNRCVEVIK